MLNKIRPLLWTFLLFAVGKTARAGVFTVTSNADSGPGTLREAIAQAAANGTTVRDSIIFALSDISLPGRTITLLSPLPELTSNLVINGVSQNGAAIGVSDARILLFHGAMSGATICRSANAFTPNGDGHNDVFRIKNPGLVKTFELVVYNRWGQKVFSTNDPYRGWDGYFNGSPSSTGGYIWVIHFTDITGSRREKNGSVLLIR